MEIEEKHQSIIQIERLIAEQGNAVAHWKIWFSQLDVLATGAINGITKMLRKAEVVLTFYNPPKEVKNFLERCKWLVGIMKNMITRAKK